VIPIRVLLPLLPLLLVPACTREDPKAPTPILKPPTTAPTPAQTQADTTAIIAKGAKLHTALGCNLCHTVDGSKSQAPTLKDLYNSQVKLDTGETVTADETYLRQAILDPASQVVAGYAPTMLPMKGTLRDDELDALIAYYKSLSPQ
jgi:cytochrome c oxidase subunit II